MSSSLFLLLFALAILIWGQTLGRKYDRERIRKNVEAGGGRIISIQVHSLWARGTRYDRSYDVTYITSNGQQITALCYTSRYTGVYWITNLPPGS
jgi:hypothetical protein